MVPWTGGEASEGPAARDPKKTEPAVTAAYLHEQLPGYHLPRRASTREPHRRRRFPCSESTASPEASSRKPTHVVRRSLDIPIGAVDWERHQQVALFRERVMLMRLCCARATSVVSGLKTWVKLFQVNACIPGRELPIDASV
jgi:hypothetical protein